MALRKLKPIEERDPYAAAVLDAFDALEESEWRDGEPPKDGLEYEMRRVCSFGNGQHGWTAWISVGWWDGRMFVRRNQMHGGTDALLGCTHWRPVTPNAGGQRSDD